MKINNFNQLMKLAINKRKEKIAVVAAEDLSVLEVVAQAEKINLGEFILIGDEDKIVRLLKEYKLDVKSEIIGEKEHAKAADLAVDLIIQGKAGVLMKGMLHSSIFLKAILNKDKGLNKGKHITQVSILEKDNNGGLMFITDCAITINPDLVGKKEVLENAVELTHKLGVDIPKVAVLASLEVINPSMQDTIDAAILSKMSERGQIKGCIVDGPFAFDNAISVEAARQKGINSVVAGNADIIVVPNLNVGNVLTKAITYIAKKTVVSATVGAAIPIVFTSRTESEEGKLLSIAVASYIA